MPDASLFRREGRLKSVVAWVSILLWILFLVPPLLTWTTQYGFVQAIQFCFFALVIPCLLVVGSPWRWLGIDSRHTRVHRDGKINRLLDLLIRVVGLRENRRGHRSGIVWAIIFVVQTIVWRTPPVVNALARDAWLGIFESLALVIPGVFLWVELIESSIHPPSTPRPYRIGISAIAMWTVWVLAYLMAMSHTPWYSTDLHASGRLLSTSADQQLTAAFMWFISAAVFMPVVFANLLRWLMSEDDPDDELYRLVRQERSRGFFGTNPS